jgi:hypothetical protein
MGRVTHYSMKIRSIKAELVQYERKCWLLALNLQARTITRERKHEASRLREALQSRILSLVSEIEDLQKSRYRDSATAGSTPRSSSVDA